MYTQEQTRELILKLQAIKKEKGLTNQEIFDLVEANKDSVSPSSISRMFKEGGENRGYNFRATVQPISKAVLGVVEKEKVANIDDNVLQAQLDALKLESQLNETVIGNLQKELDEEKRKVAHLLKQVEQQSKMLDILLKEKAEQ